MEAISGAMETMRMKDKTEINTVIDQQGKPAKGHLFVKGGGPTHPKRPTLVEEMIQRIGVENEKQIFSTMVEAAKTDWQAAQFFVDRIYPKSKPSMSIRSSIKDIINLADVEAANTAIINEVASGVLSLEGGHALMDMVEKAGNAMVKDIIKKLEDHQEALSNNG